MGCLKALDEVAYVRFASVYRQFKDVNTFVAEIEKLLGRGGSMEEGKQESAGSRMNKNEKH